MNKRSYLFYTFLLVVFSTLHGQTTKKEIYEDLCKSGGVYYAYQSPKEKQTAVPVGYTPFYICMYGRHGSRYLLDDKDYRDMITLLNSANTHNALSPLGKDVLSRLKIVYQDSKDRDGDLSSLGVKQYRGIAERMFESSPSVFNDSSVITARSSLVIRSILSMDAFCERLKEQNPSLSISRNATKRDADIMNYHTSRSDSFDLESSTWHKELNRFETSLLRPDRLVHSLFTSQTFIDKNIKPINLMWSLYWIASDMQDTEVPISFYDVFDKQELFDLWQCFNARFYITCGKYTKNDGIPLENEKPLLNDMMNQASTYIDTKKTGATFYFGHDMNLMRLVSLLGIDGYCGSVSEPADFYKVFSDFKIAPMAGNIQLTFYRHGSSDDILVKFMLNEKECNIPIDSNIRPYYHWTDVKSYMKRICSK